MSHNDSNFYKPFVFVLGALIIFTVFIIFVANVWSPDSADDPLAIAAMKKSIQPVGQSRVDEVAKPAEDDAAAPAESDTAESADAADADDSAESTASSESQEEESTAQMEEAEGDTETANAESAAETSTTTAGAAATAAMAGGAVSLKVKAAVATNCAGCHNTGLHGAAKTDDSEAWAGLSEKGLDVLTASVISGKGKMPARAESSLSDEEIGQAVQLMVTNATGSSVMAASDVAATTASAATTAADSTTEVASAEIPAEVKQVVDSTCTACHLAGVGNSPRLGDKDAWGKRLDAKGIDGLTASSIAGIGVMPPRGGSSLNDEQMKLAVEYILSK